MKPQIDVDEHRQQGIMCDEACWCWEAQADAAAQEEQEASQHEN